MLPAWPPFDNTAFSNKVPKIPPSNGVPQTQKLNLSPLKVSLFQYWTFFYSPGEITSREVELGSRSRTDCLAAELFLNSCFSDTVFVTLLRTAVETAVSEVHKLLGTGGVPALTLLFWRWLHDGLFGLYGTERLDESE